MTPESEPPDPATVRAWLRDALVAEGHDAALGEDGVELPSGLAVDAEFGDAQALAGGDVRIVTRTLAWHPVYPDGLMEYQHASGRDVRDAVVTGFRQWARLDLPALEDALPDARQACLRMEMGLPATETAPARRRRVVHGPTARWVADRQAQSDDPEHPFCPCCMVTGTFEALRPVLVDDAAHGVRLFAMRNADGSVDADCRVDGEDYPEGVEALRAYAATWPGTGAEFRKQYIVVVPVDADGRDPA